MRLTAVFVTLAFFSLSAAVGHCYCSNMSRPVTENLRSDLPVYCCSLFSQLFLLGLEAPKTPTVSVHAKASPSDTCFVSLGDFREALKARAIKYMPPGSRIQEATLIIISEHLKMTKLHISLVGDGTNRISEKIFISNGKGTIELSGINWEWQVDHPVLGDVEILGNDKQVYARFELTARLTIRTKSPIPKTKMIQLSGTPDRWFYILKGKGKDQDGSKVFDASAPMP